MNINSTGNRVQFSFKHVNFHSKQISNDCTDYFPNATELTIRFSVNVYHKSLISYFTFNKSKEIIG
jgi:hypothetical protein